MKRVAKYLIFLSCLYFLILMAFLVWLFFDFERSILFIRDETSKPLFYIVSFTVIVRLIGSYFVKNDNLKTHKI